MTKVVTALRRFAAAQEGATMVEYGLMLAFIAIVCVMAVSTVGAGTSSLYTSVSASF
jgi:pilus assembly protein Flp/PilA